MVDEPVTGAGNDDLYLPDSQQDLECQVDRDRPECQVDQPVTGTGNEELQEGEKPDTN